MKSLILEQRWLSDFPDAQTVEDLARRSSVPSLVASFLLQRGIRTPDQVARHLSPTLSSLSDPWMLSDMDRAVSRLVSAVERGERIGVFGDYDADGVTATALTMQFLQELGLGALPYIPDREQEGYGLNVEGIRTLVRQGCTLIVTVDCGVTNHEEVALAGSLGADVIVTDHHEPSDTLPAALAVINPKRADSRFAFRELSGVGVAFNLVRALRSRLHELGHWRDGRVPNLKVYLDLVAIGTIADVVPMLGDNRIMTRAGMEVLDHGCRPGLEALKSVCGANSAITAFDVGFRLAPRINAAGRMAHATDALRLLLSRDRDEALGLARTLHQLNQSRQNEEARILAEAREMVFALGARSSYVLASRSWRKGVVGIVASRLVEECSRPVLLLAVDGEKAQGSGRSPEGLNLHETLTACSRYLTAFGGHKAAAGISLPFGALRDFSAAFEQAVTVRLAAAASDHGLRVDFFASVEELTDPLFHHHYDLLEPFGAGYPAPLFSLRDFTVSRARVVGQNHLKLTLAGSSVSDSRRDLDVVAWGLGDKVGLAWADLELACMPCFNMWGGRRRLELRLKDARYRSGS